MHTIYNPKRYVEVEPVAPWSGLPSWITSYANFGTVVALTASAAVIVQIIAILANAAEFALCQSLHTGEGIEFIQYLNVFSIFGAIAVCVGIHVLKREATKAAFFGFCVANLLGAVAITTVAYSLLISYAVALACSY